MGKWNKIVLPFLFDKKRRVPSTYESKHRTFNYPYEPGEDDRWQWGEYGPTPEADIKDVGTFVDKYHH